MNSVLVSVIQQAEWISYHMSIYIYQLSVIYIHSVFRFFSHIGHYRILNREFPVLYSRSPLVIYFISEAVLLLTSSLGFIF